VKIGKGDLVACYVLSSGQDEPALLQHGIVLEVRPDLEDVLVLDSHGEMMWWPATRWRILSAKKNLDTDNKKC